jgi:hypothetical protein
LGDREAVAGAREQGPEIVCAIAQVGKSPISALAFTIKPKTTIANILQKRRGCRRRSTINGPPPRRGVRFFPVINETINQIVINVTGIKNRSWCWFTSAPPFAAPELSGLE